MDYSHLLEKWSECVPFTILFTTETCLGSLGLLVLSKVINSHINFCNTTKKPSVSASYSGVLHK